MTGPGTLDQFDSVLAITFVSTQPEGGTPEPVCFVAKDVRSGELYRPGGNLSRTSCPKFLSAARILLVSYNATAVMACLLALGWPTPMGILDLSAEFKCETSGEPNAGQGMDAAQRHYGVYSHPLHEKQSMRELLARGGPFSTDDLAPLVRHCEADAEALVHLFSAMLTGLDLPRALLRGSYAVSVAKMESTGIPVDRVALDQLDKHRGRLRAVMLEELDDEGLWQDGVFKLGQFQQFLVREEIPWPSTATGLPQLDKDTLRRMQHRHPTLKRLADLKAFLAEFRPGRLTVGTDGRNRCNLSPYQSTSGRNQPSSAEFIFLLPTWMRFLIKPEPGRALAYVDWSQQEIGIAAALSGDPALREAYRAGDPYLDFAVRAGVAPVGATKATHPLEREICKACCLGVQYGMGAQKLAQTIGASVNRSKDLLALHQKTYPVFWQWMQAAVDHAMLNGVIKAAFGWQLRVTAKTNPRTVGNFPMQANGAEMLRIAIMMAHDAGVTICAPVHDALLIEAHVSHIDEAVSTCRDAMKRASEVVLDGFSLETDHRVVTYPDRFGDVRGAEMWQQVTRLLHTIDPVGTGALFGGTSATCASI